jgi:hypothetical protein
MRARNDLVSRPAIANLHEVCLVSKHLSSLDKNYLT